MYTSPETPGFRNRQLSFHNSFKSGSACKVRVAAPVVQPTVIRNTLKLLPVKKCACDSHSVGVQFNPEDLIIPETDHLSESEASTSSMTTTATQTMPVSQRVPHTRVRPGVSKNVIYSTYQHVIELYGSQMPVLVAESLNYTPGAKDNASVNINSEIAWAWYVFGRRLLVWHIPSFTDTSLPVIAREMLLPSSDLAHNANLVYIFSGPNQKSPSCIAVSPEGLVRYWVVLGHHTTWIDVDANLGGEEVCGVHYIPPLGFIAVTTSGTMILITPTFARDYPTVDITRITPTFGWFNSIGKTVSSLIFGSQSQRLEMQNIKVLTSLRAETHWHIFLLAGFTLQSWRIEIEKTVPELIYETDLEQIIRRSFPDLAEDDTEVQIQITDMRHSEADSIIALVASDEPRRYVIVEFDGDDFTPPTFAIKMSVLAKNNINFLENVSGDLSSLRFLLLPATALVFSKYIIYAVPLSGGDEVEGEPLDLPGGIVLGGVMYKRTPIFFSGTFGFVTITPVDTSSIDVLNTSVIETSSVPSTVTEREPVTSTTMNDITHLKIAFVHYVRKNYKQCLNVITEEFPLPKHISLIDSVLSTTLVKVSLDIINDLSPKDHRWGEVTNDSYLPGTTSLLLDTQLSEKLKAHDLFLQFARMLAGVMDLGKVTKMGKTVKTIHILYEHNEKIAAAFALKKLQKGYEKTVKDAVVDVARGLNFEYSREISSEDFFYRYGSISDEAVKRILTICIEKVDPFTKVYSNIRLLKETNAVINTILDFLIKRKCKKGYYIDTAYHPWLSAESPGIFYDIIALASLNMDVIKAWGDQWFRLRIILKQFYSLCNHLLFLRMSYVSKDDFDDLTSSFIQFFIEKNMVFEALKLAYKYKNFHYLASLTYQLHQETDISGYVYEFGSEGFCLSLFKYLLSVQKYKDLLNLALPEQYELQLKEFISDLPALKWIYCLKKGDFATANEILLSLLDHGKVSIKDQEIICIYSSILCRAGAFSENQQTISLLKRIIIQKRIPDELYLQNGYDPDIVKVLSHEDIIEVYTSAECVEDRESFFLKALEVIDLIDEDNVKEIERLKLWAKAISQDAWEPKELEPPSQMQNEYVTFRLMKLLKESGKISPTFKVPTLEEICSSPVLADDERVDVLKRDHQSRYMYQYCYELIMESDNVINIDLTSLISSDDTDSRNTDETIQENTIELDILTCSKNLIDYDIDIGTDEIN